MVSRKLLCIRPAEAVIRVYPNMERVMNRYLLSMLIVIASFLIQGSVSINVTRGPQPIESTSNHTTSKWSLRNKEQGQLFLAANKLKPGIITLPSGLEYKILQHGIGDKPTIADIVIIDYIGKYINGTVFDSTYKRGRPIALRVSSVIPGWQEALQLMQTGGIWELYIPPQLAFGERGLPGIIGPNETVIYTIQLIRVKQANKSNS